MTAEAYTRFYARGHYRELISQLTGRQLNPEQVWKGQQFHGEWILHQYGPRLCAALAGGGRLLDLGGGPGGVAAAIRNQIPTEAKVVEPSEAEVAHARAQGLDAVQATAETWQPDGTYEVVLLLQTVDHLSDPLAVLQKCRSVCGKLLIVNMVDFPKWFAANQQAGGAGYRALKVDHPSNFHPNGLQALLLRAGFRPTEITEVPGLGPGHRQLVSIAAVPDALMYQEARPGPAAVNRIIKGAYQAHTWIGRYHAQDQ